MNINITGFVDVPEKFSDISAVLWDNDIQHQTYCVEQDGQQSHIELEWDDDSARVLLDFSWITDDEYNQLVKANTDYITIF
tara:strand:+ start:249 stop:491 length:243 start_codon:yes stop_codon:yes gene_type:complete